MLKTPATRHQGWRTENACTWSRRQRPGIRGGTQRMHVHGQGASDLASGVAHRECMYMVKAPATWRDASYLRVQVQGASDSKSESTPVSNTSCTPHGAQTSRRRRSFVGGFGATNTCIRGHDPLASRLTDGRRAKSRLRRRHARHVWPEKLRATVEVLPDDYDYKWITFHYSTAIDTAQEPDGLIVPRFGPRYTMKMEQPAVSPIGVVGAQAPVHVGVPGTRITTPSIG